MTKKEVTEGSLKEGDLRKKQWLTPTKSDTFSSYIQVPPKKKRKTKTPLGTNFGTNFDFPATFRWSSKKSRENQYQKMTKKARFLAPRPLSGGAALFGGKIEGGRTDFFRIFGVFCHFF